jgi:hypothetical protein
MPWLPQESNLGTHPELQTFGHSIQYYEEIETGVGTGDETGGGDVEIVYYSVNITPQYQGSYPTLVITNGLQASISGFFRGVFNDSLTILNKQGVLRTVSTLQPPEGSVWDKIDLPNLLQVISFKADTSRSRTLSYLAEAIDEDGNVLTSNTYTILAQDLNWSPGQQNLRNLVLYASSN